MTRIARKLIPTLAAVSVVLLGASRARADHRVVVPVPAVSYYAPPAAVTCYSPPLVYPPAPQVTYYTPTVTYYTPTVAYYTPQVTYYAPAVTYAAPTAVTTTRYGLFGRPRVSTTYYTPGVVLP